MKINKYYEIDPETGEILASSSGIVPVDKNGMLNGRLFVYDERNLIPMQYHVYHAGKKEIVKRSDKAVSDYEKAKKERKYQAKVETQEKKNRIAQMIPIINNKHNTDKEKLNALIEVLKGKNIIVGG